MRIHEYFNFDVADKGFILFCICEHEFDRFHALSQSMLSN